MPRTKSLGWLLTAMLLLAVVLVAGNWQLVTGKSVPIWNASTFYSPAYILVADSARSGHLLLWDPFMNGGRPDCARRPGRRVLADDRRPRSPDRG